MKHLSQEERKTDTALVEEVADWSQVHKPLGTFQDHKHRIEKKPVSVVPKSSIGLMK